MQDIYARGDFTELTKEFNLLSRRLQYSGKASPYNSHDDSNQHGKQQRLLSESSACP